MDPIIIPADGGPLDFTTAEWVLILTGAALLRLIPLLMLAGAVLKLRAFPALRALHVNLIVSATLVTALALIDTVMPELIPMTLRMTFFWSYLWIFAIAWLAVTWVRSAVKTRLHPRWIEWATLACMAALALAAAGFLIPALGTP